MRIKLNTTYRIGQTVWIVDNWMVFKGVVDGIYVYSKEYYEYELNFSGHREYWPEELIYRTKKEAQAKLNKLIHEDELPILEVK